MSLINDALKRANQARPAHPLDATDFPPLRPALGNVRAPAGITIVFPAGLLLVLGAAGWFLWQGWNIRQPDRTATGPAAMVVQAATLPAAPTAPTPSPVIPVAGENGTASPPSAANSPANSTPAPPVVEPPPVAASAVPEPRPPALKLQGIFYRTRNPSVVINSKTLFLGDAIHHATVVAIDRRSVTLVAGGHTNVLTLE